MSREVKRLETAKTLGENADNLIIIVASNETKRSITVDANELADLIDPVCQIIRVSHFDGGMGFPTAEYWCGSCHKDVHACDKYCTHCGCRFVGVKTKAEE